MEAGRDLKPGGEKSGGRAMTGRERGLEGEAGYRIFPIGVTRKEGDSVSVEIYPRYEDALLGLEKFSHVIVFYWFQESDLPEKRSVLQVHPKGDLSRPLTGVFATRSPVRPNPLAISISRVLAIRENILHIDRTDAFDGTPVIDIKPYIPASDSPAGANVPEWVSS
jgi:tRNA (adenine37-N6)-methyltransferase